MRNICFILICLVSIHVSTLSTCSAQSSGKPIFRIFANYHHGLSDEVKEETAFELARAYLGYQHNFDKHWKAAVKLDIGSPDNLPQHSQIKRYAYFKNAYIQYTNTKLKVGIGLVDMLHIGYPEKIWDHRYVLREFQDEYKFGPKADIGIFAQYHINNKIAIDGFIVNGEGYKNLQLDNKYKYGGGINVDILPGLSARIHYDITPKEVVQHTSSCIISYNLRDKMTLAIEGAYQYNTHYQQNKNSFGYSLFGMYQINDKWEVFLRYDKLASNIIAGTIVPWDLDKDGTALIGGIQYKATSFLKFALNYHDWYSFEQNSSNKSFIYLNMEVAL